MKTYLDTYVSLGAPGAHMRHLGFGLGLAAALGDLVQAGSASPPNEAQSQKSLLLLLLGSIFGVFRSPGEHTMSNCCYPEDRFLIDWGMISGRLVMT